MRWRWALAVAAVLYSSWLLAPAVNPQVEVVGGFASELAARDQPWGWVFRAADVVAGMLAAAAGVVLAVRAAGWARVGWVGMAVFGIATALDGGVTPMDCAPSVDRVCAVLERTGLLSPTHDAHSVTSAVAVAGSVLSAVGLTAATAPRSGRRRWGVGVCAVLVATSAGLLVDLAGGAGHVGLWQRVQLLAMAGWLAFAAVAAPGVRARAGAP